MKFILKFAILIITAIASVVSFICGYDFYIKRVYPLEYENEIKTSCEKYRVDPALVLAVIRTESKFNKTAKSKAGAIGLMQLMPETFKDIQNNINFGEATDKSYLEDPKINIECGVFFLSELLKKYNCEENAIIAYNAGGGKVDTWLAKEGYKPSDGKIVKYIPYKETKDYLERVSKSKRMYEKLYFNKQQSA